MIIRKLNILGYYKVDDIIQTETFLEKELVCEFNLLSKSKIVE